MPPGISPNICYIYKKFLLAFPKSICLVKEFLLVHPFIGVFWGILRQISQQLPRKTPLIFGIFFIILSIFCCYLLVYWLTKPLWNCVSASHICCSGCCSLSLSLSVWPNMYRISICRFYITIFAWQSENSVSFSEVIF